MKALLFLFLVICSTAFCSQHLNNDVLESAADELVNGLVGENFADQVYLSESDSQSELEKKVRESFDQVLEKIKDAIERGKTVREDVLEKMKELKQKMKDMKIEAGEKAKELFKKIKEKSKDFLQKLLDRLGLKDEKRALESELVELIQYDDEQSDLEKKLREKFDELLEKVKDAVERGKTVREDVIQQIKDIRQKMKDMHIKVGERAKELFNKIKEKAKDFLQKLIDRLGLKDDKETRALPEEFEAEVYKLVSRADQNEIEQKVRDAFDKLLEKVKDAVEKGKTVREDVIEKLKDLREKMKEMKIDMSNKAKDLYEKLKEKAKDFIRNLLDKLGNKNQESVAQADINIKDIFKKLKETLMKKLEREAIKEAIEKFFGKGNELADQLLELIKTKGDKGKQKVLDLIDRILGEDEDRESRSIQDVYEKVRNYFKNLKIELEERYVKFGKWVKETVKKGVDASKTKIENIKAIAREFIENAKQARKDIAVEAVEFLRPYKEDLGLLWEKVKKSVKEILEKED